MTSPLLEYFGALFEMLEEVEYILAESESVISLISSILILIPEIFGFIFSIGGSIIGFIVLVVSSVVSFIVFLFCYLVSAIAVSKLAKKFNYKHRFLAWIPIFGAYFRLYVICDLAKDKPLSLFRGKIKIKERRLSYLLYVACSAFGSTIASVLAIVLNAFPGVGTVVGSVIWLIPIVICAFFRYAYIRDLLDLFNEDKKSSAIASAVLTGIDTILSTEWALIIWIYVSLLRKKPLDPKEVVLDGEVIKE